MPSIYDWPLIIRRIKKAKNMTDVDIAGVLELDESTVRCWRTRGTWPKYDHGEWLKNEYENAYGKALPQCRTESNTPTAQHTPTAYSDLTRVSHMALDEAMSGGELPHDVVVPTRVHRLDK